MADLQVDNATMTHVQAVLRATAGKLAPVVRVVQGLNDKVVSAIAARTRLCRPLGRELVLGAAIRH